MNPGTVLLILQGIQIATAAAQGVPAALAAAEAVKRITAEGRDPTRAEWDELNAVAEALHGRVQAAAGGEGSGA